MTLTKVKICELNIALPLTDFFISGTENEKLAKSLLLVAYCYLVIQPYFQNLIGAITNIRIME